MEMFNFDQQLLLDNFQHHRINMTSLQHEYDRDLEGFDIQHHYGRLLEIARDQGTKAVSGFVPRRWAQRMAREPLYYNVLRDLKSTGQSEYVHTAELFERMPGTQEHYARFLELIGSGDNDRARAFFRAQVLKDASLASRVNTLMNPGSSLQIQATGNDVTRDSMGQVYVVCGSGHADDGFGVPQRLKQGYKTFVISVWPENQWPPAQGEDISTLADSILLYEPHDVHEQL